MKLFIFLNVLLLSCWVYSFNCPTSISLLETDVSERDKCIGKMTLHYIQEIEVALLETYKGDLASAISSGRPRHRFTVTSATTTKYLENLALLRQLRHYMNYSPRQIRLTNASDITCSAPSDSE